MPFAWKQFEPSQVGRIEKYDIPLNDWLGVKFGEGMASGLGRAIWDMGEDWAWDNGEKVAPEILNKSFAIEGHLTFKEPTTIGRAYLVSERKKEELERLARLQSASHSAASGKAFAGFVAGLAGGFANPVDLGTAFIPFVGSAEKAGRIARMGKGLLGASKYGPIGTGLRAGAEILSKGIITQEEIGIGFGAKLTGSIIDGVLSQAAVEVPIAIEKTRNQADYTAKDSLYNVLAGGLFAGGLNIGGKAIEIAYKRAIKSAVEFHSRMSVEGREALFREHEDAFISGKTPDTAGIISIDEAAVRAKVEAGKFDAEKARLEALKQEPVAPSLSGKKQVTGPNEILYLVQAEASRMAGKPGGKIAQRLLDRFMGGERSYDLFGQMADFVDRIYDPNAINPQDDFFVERVFGGEKAKQVKIVQQKLKEVRKELFEVERVRNELMQQMRANEGNELMMRQLRANDYNLSQRQAELIQVLEKVGDEYKLAGPINFKESNEHSVRASESIAKQAEVDAKQIETERNKRIAEFIEKKRKEWQDGLEGRVDEAKRAEIARQQAEGKLLSTEDAKRYEATATANKADLEILKQDVENLDAEMKEIAQKPPEASGLTQAEIDHINKELEELDMTTIPSQANSVKAAAPCAAKIK